MNFKVSVLVFLWVSQLLADSTWENTELTTHIWRACSEGDAVRLAAMAVRTPNAVTARSADGRGALFWAYEYNQPRIVNLLLNAGADEDAEDADGKKPKDFAPAGFELAPSDETFADIAPKMETPPPAYNNDDEEDDDEEEDEDEDEDEDDEDEL